MTTENIYMVVWDDEQGLCIPMVWNPQCEGAIEGGIGKNDTVAQAHQAWEQACRQRWRALSLCIKAKLEAVAAGITTFEHEFLAHFLTGDGRTVGDHIIPQLGQFNAPSLVLGFKDTP